MADRCPTGLNGEYLFSERQNGFTLYTVVGCDLRVARNSQLAPEDLPQETDADRRAEDHQDGLTPKARGCRPGSITRQCVAFIQAGSSSSRSAVHNHLPGATGNRADHHPQAKSHRACCGSCPDAPTRFCTIAPGWSKRRGSGRSSPYPRHPCDVCRVPMAVTKSPGHASVALRHSSTLHNPRPAQSMVELLPGGMLGPGNGGGTCFARV